MALCLYDFNGNSFENILDVTCLECFAVYKMSYNYHIEVVVVIYQFNAGIIITRYK